MEHKVPSRLPLWPRLFFALGKLVCRHKLAAIMAPVLATLVASIGLVDVQIKEDLRKGYTGLGAPSAKEYEAFRRFYQRSGEPYMVGLFFAGSDPALGVSRSILDGGTLAEVVRAHERILGNITVMEGGRELSFKHFCGDYCAINEPVRIVKAVLADDFSHPLTLLSLGATRLAYPVAQVSGVKVTVAFHFYGVNRQEDLAALDGGGSDTAVEAREPAAATVGYDEPPTALLRSAKLATLWFRADVNDTKVRKLLERWEIKLFQFVLDYNRDNPMGLHIVPMGDNMVNYEVMRGGVLSMPYCLLGFAMMFVFVVATVQIMARQRQWSEGARGDYDEEDAGSNSSDQVSTTVTLVDGAEKGNGRVAVLPVADKDSVQSDALSLWRVLALATATVVSPCMAAATVLGGILLLGLHLNPMMLVIPTLVLAVGVDDAFLLTHAYFASPTPRRASAGAHRLAHVFATVGPSASITSLTNGLAFGFGTLMPAPELRLFCAVAAAAMLLDLAYELTFFSGALSLLVDGHSRCKQSAVHSDNADAQAYGGGAREGAERGRRVHGAVAGALKRLLKAYCRFVASFPAKIVAVLLLACLWAVSIQGIARIKPDMDPRALIPPDSVMGGAVPIHGEYIWRDFTPVLVIVGRVPSSLRRRADYDRFQLMMADFENMPGSVGRPGTMLWLREYEDSQRPSSNLLLDSLFGGSSEYDDSDEDEGNKAALDLANLDGFLRLPQYRHLNESVHWHRNEETGEVELSSFLFTVSFEKIDSLVKQAGLLLRMRAVAGKYADEFETSVWQMNAPFCDVILQAWPVTWQSVAVTWLCMALVCAVFVQNALGVAGASLAVASICAGVVGCLHWWGCTLDPATMAFTIMAVGFSVDFTAHFSYHFFAARSPTAGGDEGRCDGGHEAGANERPVCSCDCEPATHEQRRRDVEWRLEESLAVVAAPSLQAGFSTVVCMAPLLFAPLATFQVLVKTVILTVTIGFFHGLFLLPVALTFLDKHVRIKLPCCLHV